MQEDFHYYGTYCAAYLAGYSHEESVDIAYSANFVDLCSRTVLRRIGGPKDAATTQLQLELMDAPTDPIGLQDITRIWASFHFLPYDLNRKPDKGSRRYKDKYRMICDTNGELVAKTVKLAKGKSIQAAGLAMHVLADTWAHRYFVGTPSLVFNNTNGYFYEILPGGEERPVVFRHNPKAADDPETSTYTNSVYQPSENTIMNLGHGRAGHLPDYSYVRYKYMPAWADFEEVIKDNPAEYYMAFCQMVYALQYLRGSRNAFKLNEYAFETVAPYQDRILRFLIKRQLDAAADWKAFGEDLSGQSIPEFDVERYQEEYIEATDKSGTFLGPFIEAAQAQKRMVATAIYSSGSLLAGFTVSERHGIFTKRTRRKASAKNEQPDVSAEKKGGDR